MAFVTKVTRVGSPEFVPVAERVAVFDNDGTLWSEKPVYFQLMFTIDRVQQLAPQHPEWKYDRDSHVGRLDKALEEARQGDWSVVDMRRDWNVIYPRSR